jgi:N utilization substance protein A
LSIDNTSKGPVIFLSRAYPKLISKLFELEVPEIGEGQIVIKSIAREAGSHCKVAVSATDENTDPIGAMVGQKGTRILTITNELNGEKIDVIRWAEDSSKYVGFALAPAKVRRVEIEEPDRAKVFVDADQLSLTIGKNGQNVRLAAKLTGWKIDVQEYKADIKEDEEKEEKADTEVDKEKKGKVDIKDTKDTKDTEESKTSKKKEEKVKPDKKKAPKKTTRTKKAKPDKK